MEFITLTVITFLCLLFEHTRKFGGYLLILMFLISPLAFIALTAVAIYFINRSNKQKRRKHYVQPTLPRSR